MKKTITLITLVLGISGMYAQDTSDAMRYAQDNLNGSARFRAMGGAFGAVGGDMSAISVNPAGSSLFNNNAASITLSSLNTYNKSNFNGVKSRENDNAFDLNQAGIAWVFNSRSDKATWNKFALAINYENSHNFNDTRRASGHNNESISNYFLYYANGTPFGVTGRDFRDLNYAEQQTYLGYNGYLINQVGTGNNTTQYTSNANGSGNYYQQNVLTSSGYNGKLEFNASVAYKNRLFFGANFNLHSTDYLRSTRFYEDYQDSPGRAQNGLESSVFQNDLYTYGLGFSFQAGVIAKVAYGFRAGLSYESPTWLWLSDELTQSVHGYNIANGQRSEFYATPADYTIIYPDYRLKTPSKYTGSLAYVFGKVATLSFDYTVKDYSNTKFSPEDDFSGPDNPNAVIAETFDRTTEFRLGGEYKIKQWSLRGGYRFEQSPYKNNYTIGHLKSYSGGLGYSFGRTKVDLSYTYAKRDYNQRFFERGFESGANVKSRYDNVSLTVAFEL